MARGKAQKIAKNIKRKTDKRLLKDKLIYDKIKSLDNKTSYCLKDDNGYVLGRKTYMSGKNWKMLYNIS